MKSTRFILLAGATALLAACASQSKPAESASDTTNTTSTDSSVTGMNVPPNSSLPESTADDRSATGTPSTSTSGAASTIGTDTDSTRTDTTRSATGTGTSPATANRTTGTGNSNTQAGTQTGTTQTGTMAAARSAEVASAPRTNTTTNNNDNVGRAADNTGKNERDRNDRAPTSGDQGNNQTDLKITQSIRQAVMADKSLSVTAKNVKIITAGGKVTLRGPVKSQEERAAIEAAAQKVAGVTQVDNQLEVK